VSENKLLRKIFGHKKEEADEQFVIELFFHGISLLVVLSISVRSVRKTFVIVNFDRCYSPQEV
jgi:hypothetical protein